MESIIVTQGASSQSVSEPPIQFVPSLQDYVHNLRTVFPFSDEIHAFILSICTHAGRYHYRPRHLVAVAFSYAKEVFHIPGILEAQIAAWIPCSKQALCWMKRCLKESISTARKREPTLREKQEKRKSRKKGEKPHIELMSMEDSLRDFHRYFSLSPRLMEYITDACQRLAYSLRHNRTLVAAIAIYAEQHLLITHRHTCQIAQWVPCKIRTLYETHKKIHSFLLTLSFPPALIERTLPKYSPGKRCRLFSDSVEELTRSFSLSAPCVTYLHNVYAHLHKIRRDHPRIILIAMLGQIRQQFHLSTITDDDLKRWARNGIQEETVLNLDHKLHRIRKFIVTHVPPTLDLPPSITAHIPPNYSPFYYRLCWKVLADMSRFDLKIPIDHIQQMLADLIHTYPLPLHRWQLYRQSMLVYCYHQEQYLELRYAVRRLEMYFSTDLIQLYHHLCTLYPSQNRLEMRGSARIDLLLKELQQEFRCSDACRQYISKLCTQRTVSHFTPRVLVATAFSQIQFLFPESPQPLKAIFTWGHGSLETFYRLQKHVMNMVPSSARAIIAHKKALERQKTKKQII